MTDERKWEPIETAPRDGSSVQIKLESGFELMASWQPGFMNDAEEDCCCWVADELSEFPVVSQFEI